jgi:hypothetical protein
MVARVQSVIALVGERFAITASGLKEAGFFGLEIFRSGRRHWAAKRRGSLDKDAVDRPLIAQSLMARVRRQQLQTTVSAPFPKTVKIRSGFG